MPIPRFQDVFDEVLTTLAQHHEIAAKDLRSMVIGLLELTPEELAEKNPGGGNRVKGRIIWAVSYLVQAGAVERPSRGVVCFIIL